jgi:hypothetical protein
MSSRQAVAQGGGPNVSIAGPLPVPVRDVDNHVIEPIQINMCRGPVGKCSKPTSDVFHVPAGKRLVMEYVSGHCTIGVSVPINASAAIATSVGGVGSFHFFPLVNELQTGGSPLADWAQQTRIYADGGTAIELITESQANIVPLCQAVVSGYITTP